MGLICIQFGCRCPIQRRARFVAQVESLVLQRFRSKWAQWAKWATAFQLPRTPPHNEQIIYFFLLRIHARYAHTRASERAKKQLPFVPICPFAHSSYENTNAINDLASILKWASTLTHLPICQKPQCNQRLSLAHFKLPTYNPRTRHTIAPARRAPSKAPTPSNLTAGADYFAINT